MKKVYFFWAAIFLMICACQRSQFSTTTRHSRNGKTTYVNHYPKEKTKLSKVTVQKNHLKETPSENNSPAPDRTGAQKMPELEITAIDPVPLSGNENLIASTSKEPAIIAVHKTLGVNVFPDTIKSNVPKKEVTYDSVTQQVIKFKNGKKETVKIISQTRDTLKYELISEKGIGRTVMMEQVDSILLVKSYFVKEEKGNGVDTRKTEPLGKAALAFSVLGFIPFIGIVFSILAIVFGAVSLHKINRHPEKYKGKRIAIASVTLGILTLLGNAIIIIAIAASGGIGVSM